MVRHNAILVFLHETDEPCEPVFFNPIPIYLSGTPQQEEAEQAIRQVVHEQITQSGPWFGDFLKVLVVKDTETFPYNHSDIYGT